MYSETRPNLYTQPLHLFSTQEPYTCSITQRFSTCGPRRKVVRNSEFFPRKCKNFFRGPRTETKFVKWSASRKRLRTAAITYLLHIGYTYYIDVHCVPTTPILYFRQPKPQFW